ncbi:hypothetical protein MMC18_001980 [Xylographa bjoerkii]|nr:hypothetical protein [Xylographa bjoerkii]
MLNPGSEDEAPSVVEVKKVVVVGVGDNMLGPKDMLVSEEVIDMNDTLVTEDVGNPRIKLVAEDVLDIKTMLCVTAADVPS